MGSGEADRVRELFAAYHAEQRDPSDDELDAALGIPSHAQRWTPRQDTAIQARYTGESTVNVLTPYAICRGLFRELNVSADDLVIDLGCASGRVVLYGALVTDARFRGVELVAERAQQGIDAAERLGLTKVQFVVGNALDEDLSRGNVFYLFRPFSERTEAAVVAELHAQGRRRPITVATHRLQPSLFDPQVFTSTPFGALVLYRTAGL